ncbi:MAG: hypothetical protein MJZ08_01105 [Bacteroidaceae bacterium]|nr:hypothetical protein [Bacteroidaceae bacterium]
MRKLTKSILSLCLMFVGIGSVMAETETMVIKPSDDVRLRKDYGKAYPANTGDYEFGSGSTGCNYGFCALQKYNISELRAKLASGYAIESVVLQLTNSSNVNENVYLYKCDYAWSESKCPKWEDVSLENYVTESNELGYVTLKNGGNKPFALANREAVYPYDLTKFQSTGTSEALTDYVKNTNSNSLGFVLALNHARTSNLAGAFSKDADATGYGTSTIEEYQWKGSAWEKTGATVTRYQQMLTNFNMTEAEFKEAVAPKLIVTLLKKESGLIIPTSIPKAVDLSTSAPQVFLTNENNQTGPTTFVDNKGNSSNQYYCTTENAGIFYLGRYNPKDIVSMKVNASFSGGKAGQHRTINIVTMDATDSDVDKDYLTANGSTIRGNKNYIAALRGTQYINGTIDGVWNSGILGSKNFLVGTDYILDFSSISVTADTQGFIDYWTGVAGVTSVDATGTYSYTDGSGNPQVAVTEVGSRFSTIVNSGKTQDFFIWGYSGRLGVSSIIFNLVDKSTQLPVLTMNGQEVGRSLGVETILASTGTAGDAITEVELGEISTKEQWEAISQLKSKGIAVRYTTGSFNLDVTELGWASMYLDCAVAVPTGATAYYANSASASSIALTAIEAGNVIPANTGVIVKAAKGEHIFAISAETPAAVTDLFAGVTFATPCEANVAYVLSGESTTEKPIFGLYTGTTLGAYKAYLPLDKVPTSAKETIEFTFEGTPTGIEEVESSMFKTQGSAYNLNGVRVNDNYKGVVIKNGKAYINK